MGKFIWKDKVVIITGASSGIGYFLALELACRGALVALAARNSGMLENLVNQIVRTGGEAMAIPTDVSVLPQVVNLIQQTIARWDKIDVVVANAGQYIRSPIQRMSLTDLERSMAVNFYGGIYPVITALPHMLSRQAGHIVFVSSMDAKKGLPLDAPYVAAKFALSGFGEVLRQELFGTGIGLTIVFPGRVDTPMIEHLEIPRISAKIPAGKVATAIRRGVERNKAEVIIPAHVQLLHWLNFFSPRSADLAVRVFHLEGYTRAEG